MQLDTLCEQYLSVRTKIRSTLTRDHYRRSVEQFGAYLGRDATADDLTDDALSGFILATVNAGFSPVTANQRVKQLRALWNWAAKKRLVEQFPTFEDLDEHEPRTQLAGQSRRRPAARGPVADGRVAIWF